VQFCFGERSVYVNFATSDALQQEVMDRFKARAGFSLATINLDHLVKLSASDSYLSTYLSQDLVVADGRPIVWLSKLAGCPVELMPGSDMVEPLCRWAATAGVSVAFVGSTQAALADAERVLAARVPGLNVAWTHAPGRLDPESAEVSEILDELAARNIGLCFLALGAPKQERIAQRGRGRMSALPQSAQVWIFLVATNAVLHFGSGGLHWNGFGARSVAPCALDRDISNVLLFCRVLLWMPIS